MENKKPKNRKHKSTAYSIFIVTLASIFLSFSIAVFINPLGLYASGVTGIAQLLLQLICIIVKIDYNTLNVEWLGIVNFVLLLPFDIFAYFKLSKKYGLYSILSSVVQTIMFFILGQFNFVELFVRDASSSNVIEKFDMFACVTIAGIITGATNAIIYRRGGTSGGISILSQYYNFKKGKSVGFINFIISAFILLAGASISFVNSNDIAFSISIALYTLIMFMISSIVLDYYHTSYNKIKLEIVTEKGDDICKSLIENTPHGITISKATGAYTKREKEVVFVIIQKYEQMKYVKIIKSIDEHAFITTTPVTSFSGNFKLQIIDK